MYLKKFMVCVAILMAGLCFGPAADILAAGPDFSLGLGVGAAPDYEGSEDYEAVIFPTGSVRWDNGRSIELAGDDLKANLIAGGTWAFGPILKYIPERDNVESDAVDDMRKVDASFMLGAFTAINISDWYLRLEATHDVADGNEGLLVQFGGGYNWKASKTFQMVFDVFTTYADDEYMEAYFEVDARDSTRSGLKEYEAEGDMKDAGLSVTAICRPYENWSFMGIVSFTRLLGDAEDSPVVDDEGDSNQYFAGFAVNYHF